MQIWNAQIDNRITELSAHLPLCSNRVYLSDSLISDLAHPKQKCIHSFLLKKEQKKGYSHLTLHTCACINMQHEHKVLCVVWNLEWKHSWMAASISPRKPSNWWQCIYIFIHSFQLHLNLLSPSPYVTTNIQIMKCSPETEKKSLSLTVTDRMSWKQGENANDKLKVGQICLSSKHSMKDFAGGQMTGNSAVPRTWK